MLPQKKTGNARYLMLAFFLFYGFNRAAALYRTAEGRPVDRLIALFGVFDSILQRPFYMDLSGPCVLAGMLGLAAAGLAYAYFVLGAHKLLQGKEHGSAEWGTEKDIAPLMDKKNPENNVILTQTESLLLRGFLKPKGDIDPNRNKNIVVCGGSGGGKTRRWVKPNLLQMNANFVITDPKGALLEECGCAFVQNGYKIKVFNLVDREHSDHYNPLAYVDSIDDAVKLAKNMVANLKPDPRAQSTGDPIWEESMTAKLQALICYARFELRPEDQNMNSVMQLFALDEIREDVPGYVSPLDLVFQWLEKSKPGNFASQQYAIYKMAAPKTAESINISLGMRLSSFNIPSIRDIVSDDTLALRDFANDEKVVLFIVTPDTTMVYNFLAAVMYQQLFDTLILAADSRPDKQLPRHCRLIMDEFANIGQIPDFEKIIATIRSREISVALILQSIQQLKSMYKDDWATIIDNCDTLLFLGGSKVTDNLKFFSELLGDATIETENQSESHGSQGSWSRSWQKSARRLMNESEIQKMSRSYCLLWVTGLPPFYSRKYDLLQHPNYHLLKDADPNNRYDLSRRAEYETIVFMSDVTQAATVRLTELNNLQ